jgi:hypothetical protein
MKEQILEVSEKLRLDLITKHEARNILLGLLSMTDSGTTINMQKFMLYYSKSNFEFTDSVSDVIIKMLNEK